MEKLEEFLKGYGYDFGFGDGSGKGFSFGDGFGYGSGEDFDFCDGSGDGNGDGCGFGDGCGDGGGEGLGDGSGFGDGGGDGLGYGNGYGHGRGYGEVDGNGDGGGSPYYQDIINFRGNKVYEIDGINTILTSIKGQVAKGFIIDNFFQKQPCFVGKCGDFFAHGETTKKALLDAKRKYFSNSPVEERIDLFLKDCGDKNTLKENSFFFDWHGLLTGSCEFGRKQFCEENNIDLSDKMSLVDFLRLTKDSYGVDVIQKIIQILEI